MVESDALRALARQILDDAVKGSTLVELAGGLQSTSGRLQSTLVRVLGPTGTRQLWSYSVRQAATREPCLTEVAVDDDGIETTGILRGRSDQDFAVLLNAFSDLLATFFESVAHLVGPKLTLELIRDALAIPAGWETETDVENDGWAMNRES